MYQIIGKNRLKISFNVYIVVSYVRMFIYVRQMWTFSMAVSFAFLCRKKKKSHMEITNINKPTAQICGFQQSSEFRQERRVFRHNRRTLGPESDKLDRADSSRDSRATIQ